MEISIRQEEPADQEAVFKVVEEAFKSEEYSDHDEQFLVNRLRKSSAFIPELSLVALVDNKIVGHILLTRVQIKNESNDFDALSLAPVSVLPEYQRKGIGTQLIEKAHEAAKELGHQLVVLIGHEHYYPRFGYQQANTLKIEFPFDAPAQNCMVMILDDSLPEGLLGQVQYPKEFFTST